LGKIFTLIPSATFIVIHEVSGLIAISKIEMKKLANINNTQQIFF